MQYHIYATPEDAIWFSGPALFIAGSSANCISKGRFLQERGSGLAVDVVCIIGERLYHAAGSACDARLRERGGGGPLLTLTEAQAHEVGMEPCGVCMPRTDENAR